MNILHTSDWHLGRQLHGYHLIEDQAYMIEQVLKIIATEKIDVVVIAGDVYDKAIPNEEAVTLFDAFLARIAKVYNIPTLIIAGNHDSNTRIHFGSTLFQEQNVYLIGKTATGYQEVVLGDTEKVHFYLIPYMEPAEVRIIAEDETIKRHDDAMRYLTDKIKTHHTTDEAAVVIAHAFVAGGDVSDSERRLCSVGTAEMVGADCFKPFTYTALGHLHKGQAIGSEHIRYSGSPLKYSTSEANQPKGVTCLTIEEGTLKSIKEIPLKPLRDLRVVKGPLEALIRAGIASDEAAKEDYIFAKLTDAYVEDAVATLRKVYPYILGAELEKPKQSDDTTNNPQVSFQEKRAQSLTTLFETFMDSVLDEPLTEAERIEARELIATLEKEVTHEA